MECFQIIYVYCLFTILLIDCLFRHENIAIPQNRKQCHKNLINLKNEINCKLVQKRLKQFENVSLITQEF